MRSFLAFLLLTSTGASSMPDKQPGEGALIEALVATVQQLEVTVQQLGVGLAVTVQQLEAELTALRSARPESSTSAGGLDADDAADYAQADSASLMDHEQPTMNSRLLVPQRRQLGHQNGHDPTPEPTSSPTPSPTPSPTAGLCDDSCDHSGSTQYTQDDSCDDGGEGAEFDNCAFGTDCTDCGVRPTSVCYGSDGETIVNGCRCHPDCVLCGCARRPTPSLYSVLATTVCVSRNQVRRGTRR
jgi:hypothetical protein